MTMILSLTARLSFPDIDEGHVAGTTVSRSRTHTAGASGGTNRCQTAIVIRSTRLPSVRHRSGQGEAWAGRGRGRCPAAGPVAVITTRTGAASGTTGMDYRGQRARSGA